MSQENSAPSVHKQIYKSLLNFGVSLGRPALPQSLTMLPNLALPNLAKPSRSRLAHVDPRPHRPMPTSCRSTSASRATSDCVASPSAMPTICGRCARASGPCTLTFEGARAFRGPQKSAYVPTLKTAVEASGQKAGPRNLIEILRKQPAATIITAAPVMLNHGMPPKGPPQRAASAISRVGWRHACTRRALARLRFRYGRGAGYRDWYCYAGCTEHLIQPPLLAPLLAADRG